MAGIRGVQCHLGGGFRSGVATRWCVGLRREQKGQELLTRTNSSRGEKESNACNHFLDDLPRSSGYMVEGSMF